MPTTATLRKRARPQEVYQQLRALIIDGRLAPGTRIVETDVATRLGVSRTPVRGAFQRLQQEGYVVDSPTLQQTRPTVARSRARTHTTLPSSAPWRDWRRFGPR
jgi:DNA-binding GntR family transcriptional regulator